MPYQTILRSVFSTTGRFAYRAQGNAAVVSASATRSFSSVPPPAVLDPNAVVPVAVAHGDGIGPEIMESTLRVLEAAQARIDPIPVKMGLEVYESGISTGISEDAWETIHRTKLLLKAPITTPRGGGVKSLNVTMRKTLGLFCNLRPCFAMAPFVPTHFPKANLVIVRENEEDLYGGIEHRQTAEVTQCLKLISQPGSERIIRYAFEYAKANAREKVTCVTKSNIMKLTDGLFESIFHDVAREYKDIRAEHMIVDIAAARLAADPESFDVVVLPNLYGDVLSDIAAEVLGSVGLAGSANIGTEYAMFEAIHGSAPDIAGNNIANPSGLLSGAIKMLAHVGHLDTSSLVHNAWLRTIEDGVHTADIYSAGVSSKKASTTEFTDAVIANLGNAPREIKTRRFGRVVVPDVPRLAVKPIKTMTGVDVFVDWDTKDRNPADLAKTLKEASAGLPVELTMISNRGTLVWPGPLPATTRMDHWRCRFRGKPGAKKGEFADVDHESIIKLLANVSSKGLDFIKIETLCNFDGVAGFSKGQGE